MLKRFSCISFLFKSPCSNQRNGSEMTFLAAATKINPKLATIGLRDAGANLKASII